MTDFYLLIMCTLVLSFLINEYSRPGELITSFVFIQTIGPFMLLTMPPTFDTEITVAYQHGNDRSYLVASWTDVAGQEGFDTMKLSYQYAIGKETSFFSSPKPLVSVVHRLSSTHNSNIFFSETAGPIKTKFHMEPPGDGGTKVCSGGLGHMTKMAAMPINGKNTLKIFSGTKGRMTLGLGMQHSGF